MFVLTNLNTSLAAVPSLSWAYFYRDNGVSK